MQCTFGEVAQKYYTHDLHTAFYIYGQVLWLSTQALSEPPSSFLPKPQASRSYEWRAEKANLELPYVCMSKCKFGYRWFPKVGRCLRVEAAGVGSTASRTLPRAMLQCGAAGGHLAPLASCAELDALVDDMREFTMPAETVYLVGNFHGLREEWSSRHEDGDVLTDA